MHQQAVAPNFPFARPGLPPPREYGEFQRAEGLGRVRLWDGTVVWLATRYQDVRAILADNRFSADGRAEGYPAISAARAEIVKNQPPTFIRMDPPDHGRMRKMLTKEFAHHKIQSLRPKVEEIVSDLIDHFGRQSQPADFVREVALPLPSIMIAYMIGVPYEEHEYFQERSATKINLDSKPEDAVKANQELRSFLGDLIERKAKDPTRHDDIMGHLLVDQIEPGHLTIDEAISTVELLLMAGHETTANMSTLGVLSILQDEEALAAFRKGPPPELVRQAVEEMLRYHTIVHFTGTRVAVEDVEVGGETIRKGEGVLAMIAGANHDPDRFEDPTRFNVFLKRMAPHVAFGFGVHQCLGQPLARLELEVLFNNLFVRMPTLRLGVPSAALDFKRNVLVHGVHELPLCW